MNEELNYRDVAGMAIEDQRNAIVEEAHAALMRKQGELFALLHEKYKRIRELEAEIRRLKDQEDRRDIEYPISPVADVRAGEQP